MKIKALQKPRKDFLIQIKVTDEEKKALQVKANRFADGNISAWVRYAAIVLNPRRIDIAGKADE